MELNIKTTVNQLSNGKTVQIYDSTLDYHIDDNPGGWCTSTGQANPMRSTVDSLTIIIEMGSLTETIVYTDAADIAKYLDPTQGLLLSSLTLFGSAYTVFEDGIYTITVTMAGHATLVDGATDYTVDDQIYEYFGWAMWNRIRKLVATIEVPIKNYLEAYKTSLLNTLYDSIIYNCQFGHVENAQNNIDYLTNVLDNNTSLTELFKNFENYG